MQRRTRVPGLRALLVGAWGLAGALSCSEIHEPLDWDEAVRGGLGQGADTLVTDSVVVADVDFAPSVVTGSSATLLAGGRVRDRVHVDAQTYLHWDLSDLPGGSIVEAYVQLILRDTDQADSAAVEPFQLWMYELTEDWSQSELDTLPAQGPFVAASGEINASGASDTSSVLLNRLFAGADLRALVGRWRQDAAGNHGVVLLPSDAGAPGFLRLVSAEGRPAGSISDLSSPALVVTIDTGSGDTTTTREADEDAYVVDVREGDTGLADSLLLVSSGYVRRAMLRLERATFVAPDPARFPTGTAIHRAALRLPLAQGSAWQLGEDESVTLQIYETDAVWSEAEPPTSSAGVLVATTTLDGGAAQAVFDVQPTMQRILEGAAVSLVVRCQSETGSLRSVVFLGRTASAGRPQLELSFTRPGEGRLGPWP